MTHSTAGWASTYGGEGDDTISGGINYGQAFGGAGNDLIDGMERYDTLFGGTGSDALPGKVGQSSSPTQQANAMEEGRANANHGKP